MPFAWLRRLRRRPPTAAVIGRRGERVAVRALRRAGYRIVATNVATPRAEVDVVAVEAGHLVIVEVKTTAVAGGPPPGRRLGARQRQRLVAAGRWLQPRTATGRLPLRFDLVTVRLAPRPPAVCIHRGVLARTRSPDAI